MWKLGQMRNKEHEEFELVLLGCVDSKQEWWKLFGFFPFYMCVGELVNLSWIFRCLVFTMCGCKLTWLGVDAYEKVAQHCNKGISSKSVYQ
jgi:hypothetical protein